MGTWLPRLNYLIKHQLYLRILPVVVVAVLAVGLFSGRLLTNRAVNTYIEQEEAEHEALLSDLVARITIDALAAEARKDEQLNPQWPRSGTEAPPTGLPHRLRDDLLNLAAVCGAALISLDPDRPPDSLSVSLRTRLRTGQNLIRLRDWGARQKDAYLRQDWLELVSRASWPGGPRSSRIDDFHSLYLFPPLELEEAPAAPDLLWPLDDEARLIPVLPVVVEEEAKWAYPLTRRDGSAWSRPQLLLLLDVAQLLAAAPRTGDRGGDVSMLLDARGRILAATVDTLRAGTDLTRPRQRLFPGVDGRELAVFLHGSAPAGSAHASLGSRLNPHIFTSASRPELPMLLVSALPFSKIHGGLFLYTAIVVLMAVIALLGCVLAITQVGERLSQRLQTMSASMGEVAAGNYSLRMQVREPDEVGRLVSYFNLMTAGLEEAHAQLREKTQRLRVALANMKRLDKAKDDFLTLISHEVRTPLTSIMGGIEFLQLVLPQATEEQRRAVEQLKLPEIIGIIESSGNRLRDFMNDAILMTSLQSSSNEVRFEPVPLGDVCEMVLSGLQEQRAQLELTIANELGEADGWYALGDRQLLSVALQKLLRNAVQHNHRGGRVRVAAVEEIPGLGPIAEVIPPEVRRELLARPGLARWRPEDVRWRGILVYNTGPAIPAGRREALFRKFELVGRIEHHQRGSGLSLAIVQAILENHGGKIYVDSREGDGNYFYLLGPAVAVDARPRPEPACADSDDEQGQGAGGVAGDEEVDAVAQGAALEVELEHAGA